MGTLVFQATLGGAVNIIGPNIANTINFTLPSADGTSGQTWTTNGSGVLAFGTLGIAGGGTGQITATAAFNALAPSQSGQSGKYLTTDGTNTSWGTNPLGTVTSVGGTGTVNGITLTGTVTTSGNLTLGGTLSNVSLTSQVTGTLPTANGGTNLTSFTSGGVVYASSTSALATGSALTFDGTTATTPRLAFGGTTLPAAGTATIFGRSSDNRLYLQSGSGNDINFLDGSQNTMLTLAPSTLIFQISNAEIGRFTSTGLGIGTSSLASIFTINGNDPLITLKNAGTNRWQFGLENTSSNRFVFYDNTAAAYRLIITDVGQVGIGTSTFATNSKFAVQTSTCKLDIVSEGGSSIKLLAGSGGMTLSAPSGFFFDTSGTQQFEARNLQLYSNGTIKATTSISVGNATPSTSGAGITFPATQSASSDANTLDDYEEGTWTPAPNFSTSNTASVSTATGTYTKVGRLVTATMFLTFDKSTATGNLTITGLPFTNINAVGGRSGFTISFLVRIGQADKIVTGYVNENTSVIQLYFTSQNSTSSVADVTNSDIDANTAYIVGSVTYQTA
jgi:hypothetical protein